MKLQKNKANNLKHSQRNTKNNSYREMTSRLTTDFPVAHSGSQKNNGFKVLGEIIAGLELYTKRNYISLREGKMKTFLDKQEWNECRYQRILMKAISKGCTGGRRNIIPKEGR